MFCFSDNSVLTRATLSQDTQLCATLEGKAKPVLKSVLKKHGKIGALPAETHLRSKFRPLDSREGVDLTGLMQDFEKCNS